MPGFRLITTDAGTHARQGLLTCHHGEVATPAFMPVGTVGAVKGLLLEQVRSTGADIVLANTYHFLVRPGVEVVEKLGGLNRFMAWDYPILTDSGGYQVFSLSTLNKIDDEGVAFASHVDGRSLYLNAEIATTVQNRLGADIIMCFDQCTPYPCERSDLEAAVARTIRWAAQCRAAHNRPTQMLFGIVQGGLDLNLRRHCAAALVDLDFPGYAIGGLSVGEGHRAMVETVDHTAPLLPADKPRYLMGVGMPADLIAAVRAGVDMFDCVLPTRNGRNGFAFTAEGPLRLRNSHHTDSGLPVEAGCPCACCQNYTRAAVRHFFIAGEMLGPILLSLHNLHFFQRLMDQMRAALTAGEFDAWSEHQLAHYRSAYGVKS